MKQEAQAQGMQEPDAAFEQRLEALRKNAKSRTQVDHCCCMLDSPYQRCQDSLGQLFTQEEGGKAAGADVQSSIPQTFNWDFGHPPTGAR